MRQFKLILFPLVALVLITLVLSQAWSSAAGFFQETPTPGFGSIVGPGYTPPAVATSMPVDVQPPPCQVVVTQPQLFLYATPDALTQPTGTAVYMNQFVVYEVRPDGWVSTDQGWLMLASGATLQDTRPCAILEGRFPRTTVFGLHIINTAGTTNEVLSLAQRLAANGTPLGTVKGLNGTEGLLDQVKQASPQTTVIFRSLYTTQGEYDCPADLDTAPDLAVLAQQWMDSLQGAWAGINADYYELMNECGATVERQTQFSIEAMKLANQQGRCLLLYSFTAGQPAVEDFLKILPAVEFALQNPCRPGEYHGIAMHGYSFKDGVGLSEADPWMTLRHRELYEALIKTLPDAKNIPFYLTEAGIGGGGFLNTPPCDLVVQDVVQYTFQLEQDPYVRGYNEWSFGAGTRWYDLTPCLEGIGSALITYYNKP